MEWNLDCKSLITTEMQKEKTLAVDKGKEDNSQQKKIGSDGLRIH
jgi:hypothetical protein